MNDLIQKLRELEASEEVAGEAANELSALREKVAQLAEQQQKAIGVIEVVTEDGKVTVPAYAAPVVPDGMVRPDQEALQQIIAAALYDFGGFLSPLARSNLSQAPQTTQPTPPKR